MKIVAIVLGVVGVALVGWVGYKLSPEATAMAVGIVLGVLAGVPATLLMMAGNRRQQCDDNCAQPSYSVTRWEPETYPADTPKSVIEYIARHGGRVVKEADGTLTYISVYGQPFPLTTVTFKEEVW